MCHSKLDVNQSLDSCLLGETLIDLQTFHSKTNQSCVKICKLYADDRKFEIHSNKGEWLCGKK
jgi:hypothetical protein